MINSSRIEGIKSEKYEIEEKLKQLDLVYSQALSELKKDSVLLPSLTRWVEVLQKARDNSLERALV